MKWSVQEFKRKFNPFKGSIRSKETSLIVFRPTVFCLEGSICSKESNLEILRSLNLEIYKVQFVQSK